ncbi:HDOD domain-containing protein [Desulfovibrio litoralis]|uniref:HD-like signal output (HDOD) domain, no enzymatic activity n=1 Tax=Desulfovibrio litoralis DSM 11393 TaxID=1121455 RepID=A0A1M7SG03_9BACT|nr:HDOD domain-containing protein [Desulfovibrio litoralis]SHN57411.1 HD-like signal output (HDOD) domain, no enzymatic activity [Desulfovibrio litoralis DSM 11393]
MSNHFKTAQLFLEELQNNPPRLPYDSKIVSKLFDMTHPKSDSATKDIAGLIEKDPGLTAKILRLSNSPRYSLISQVSTPLAAVTVLGLNEIRNLILITGVRLSIKPKKFPLEFNFTELWQHQLLTGACARVLSYAQNNNIGSQNINHDEVYTASLLHDLGKVMIAALRPNDWLAINQLEKEKQLSTQEAEDSYWGLDHGLIAGRVLESWGLPRSLTEPIIWHHYPELAKEHKKTALFIAIANYLASEKNNLQNFFSENNTPSEFLSKKITQHLNELDINIDSIMPNILKIFEDNKYISIADEL